MVYSSSNINLSASDSVDMSYALYFTMYTHIIKTINFDKTALNFDHPAPKWLTWSVLTLLSTP